MCARTTDSRRASAEAEELLLQRGAIVSYETIRRWCASWPGLRERDGRRCWPRPGDKWHLDEVFIKINGEHKYLWRAVDQDGNVLDILVQNRRDKAAARRFCRPAPRCTRRGWSSPTSSAPTAPPTARSCPPSSTAHTRDCRPARELHQPTRQRERAMKGFRSIGGAQRFLSAFSGISPHFPPHRHLMTAPDHRAEMTIRFAIWDTRSPTLSADPPRSDQRPGTQQHHTLTPPDLHTRQRDSALSTSA